MGCIVLAGLLLTCGTLAVTSTVGDSITYDETNHLTGGMSYLLTGDFRLAPETPPLAQSWAALPLLAIEQQWPSADRPGWRAGEVLQVGREWLFALNDGERMVFISRCAIVLLLLATCFFTHRLALILFGPVAALLTAAIACFSPTLLAHGSLVTTDVAFALGCLVVMLSFARLTTGISLGRVLVAVGAMAGLALVKFSWPIIVPAVLVIIGVAVMRPRAIPYGLWRPSPETGRLLACPRDRLLAFAVIGLLTIVIVWGAIWTCFGWRYSPFRGGSDPRAMMPVLPDPDRPYPTTMDQAWSTILADWEGKPMTGPVAASIRMARRHRLLPEAYLYGFAHTLKFMHGLPTYLKGEYSRTGWWTYFPTAFLVKTPVATLLLLVVGLAALLSKGRAAIGNPPLLFGVLTFVAVYGLSAILGDFNIGHRHLVPIYPILFVVAGCAVRWLPYRAGRWLVAASCLLLVLTNLAAFPHYLGFFNAAVGGSSNGHKYLADSNIDWGQDLKRLAAYARQMPDETIKLAYFGSALPTAYGFRCEAMPSQLPFGPPAKLTAGVYVSSVTQLLGVYDRRVRDSFWNANNLATYRVLHQDLAAVDQAGMTDRQRAALAPAVLQYEELRRVRVLNRLGHRPPDLRIGTSLFVHRLSQAEIDEYTDPGDSSP